MYDQFRDHPLGEQRMTDDMDDAIALLEVELGAEVVKTVTKGVPDGDGAADFQGEQERDSSSTGLTAPFYRPQWGDNVEEVESEVLNGHEDVEGVIEAERGTNAEPEGIRSVCTSASVTASPSATSLNGEKDGTEAEAPSDLGNTRPEGLPRPSPSSPAAPSLPERPFDKSHVNFPELMSDNRTEPKALVTYGSYKMVLEREVVLVYGDPGVGKSLLLLDLLTKGSAAQMDFHGDRVMWVDEEGDEDILRERLLLLKVDPAALTNWRYYLNRGFYLDVDKTREDLFDKVEAFQPNVVVIDSATRVRLHSDENNATEMARFYSLVLKPLSRTFGCSVLLIDHSRKRGHFDREANQQARGSIEKLAQVDRAWMLRKVGKDSFVIDHAKVRRGTPPPRLLIERYFENFTKTFAHKLKNVLHDE